MNKTKLAFTFILLLLSHVAYAVLNEASDVTKEFNVTAANKIFDTISLKLSTHNLNSDDLKNAITITDKLHHEAQRCIEENQSKITLLDNFLKESQVNKTLPPVTTNTQNADYKYLQSKITQYTAQASNCRLFVIRTQVALVAYKQTIQKLTTQQTLQRTIPLWELAGHFNLPSFEHINFAEIYSLSGIALLTPRDVIILTILLCLGVAAGSYARQLLRLLLKYHAALKFKRIIKVLNSYTVNVLAVTLLFTGYFTVIFYSLMPKATLQLIAQGLLGGLLLVNLAKIFIFSLPRFTIFRGLLHHQVKPIYSKLRWVLLWIFCYYLISVIFRQQQIPENLIDAAMSLFFTILIILTAWFFWFFTLTLCFNITQYRIRSVLKALVIGAFSLILFIQLIGYHRLASYIFIANILTIFTSFITRMLLKFNENACNFLENNKSNTSQRFRYYLGVKPYKKLSELVLIRMSFAIIIVSIYGILMLKIWKISVIYSDQVIDILVNGFKVGGLSIYPSRVLLALIIFGVSLLCGRFVATYITRYHEFEGERDTQVAVASIIKYMWVAITVIVSLLISGFNFTNLAIIAGAFSVGIGLGLQHIVTNFVSGLILLLEKPIKPGDRIAVNGIEGFVHKIRARSTQITTTANEDVIVPNSDLINQPVTNYMFRNPSWRLTCSVGVAYNSDIDLVQHLLLELANRHPEVIKDSQSKPSVCFYEFGGSSLNFKLWCMIGDVNKKYQILSELNGAIYHAFKQHHIEIAFPQLDVHIKKEVL